MVDPQLIDSCCERVDPSMFCRYATSCTDYERVLLLAELKRTSHMRGVPS
jgi:hypothetical protein